MFKTLLIVGAVIMSSCGVALADVPNPYGRPRPGVTREARQYQINRVGFYTRHASCPGDKVMLELTCTVPKNATIAYKLRSAEGETIDTGKVAFEKGYGNINLYIDKPKDGEKVEVIFDSVCELRVMQTPFGPKQTKTPIFSEVKIDKYIIFQFDNDYDFKTEHIKCN